MNRRDRHELITAEFTCDRCGSLACRVTLVPPFARDPQAPLPGMPGWIPGVEKLMGDQAGLSIDGPVKLTHALLPRADGGEIPAIVAALEARDALALYSINPEYAPFLCRPCAKAYCKDHWAVSVRYADDYPGWYEDTRARCPKGHERVMDD